MGQHWFQLCLPCRRRQGTDSVEFRSLSFLPLGLGWFLGPGPVAFSSHVPCELEPRVLENTKPGLNACMLTGGLCWGREFLNLCVSEFVWLDQRGEIPCGRCYISVLGCIEAFAELLHMLFWALETPHLPRDTLTASSVMKVFLVRWRTENWAGQPLPPLIKMKVRFIDPFASILI